MATLPMDLLETIFIIQAQRGNGTILGSIFVKKLNAGLTWSHFPANKLLNAISMDLGFLILLD